MNYIAELNAFYTRLQTHPLSSNAIALWGGLMNIANKAGWPKMFTTAESVLAGTLSMSHAKFSRARAELVAAGLIIHVPQKGNKAPYYAIKSLAIDKAKDKGKLIMLNGGMPSIVDGSKESAPSTPPMPDSMFPEYD